MLREPSSCRTEGFPAVPPFPMRKGERRSAEHPAHHRHDTWSVRPIGVRLIGGQITRFIFAVFLEIVSGGIDLAHEIDEEAGCAGLAGARHGRIERIDEEHREAVIGDGTDDIEIVVVDIGALEFLVPRWFARQFLVVRLIVRSPPTDL